MTFPKVLFGKCEYCGGGGGDDPDAANADAAATDITGNGFPLTMYMGKAVCRTCKNLLKADEESRQASLRIAQDERFRQRAGFVKTVT